MGNFLDKLSEVTQQKPITNPLLGNSLSKLREYYGSFKSVCDTYSIDLTEYDNIFSSNETSFKIWDTDNNGYIDALELFSGLILFSDATFEQKIRFLFDIFDFNELNTLGVIDLQFMFISCCNSTLKIYGRDQGIDEDEIGDFLNNYFSNDCEIDIEKLNLFTKKVKEIFDFAVLIEKQAPEQATNLEINLLQIDSYADDEDSNLFNASNIKHTPQQLGLVSKEIDYMQKCNYMEHMADKLYSNQDNSQQTSNKDVHTKLNWVFGFKCRGVKQPLEYQYSKSQGEKAESQKIIYFSGCIAIVYFPKLFQQKHYIEHDYEIISIAKAKKNSLVATGELAEIPSIHIWDSFNLQNYGIIKGIHRNGIHLMQFFKNDELLASCGMRENSQILIYNIKDLSLVLSTYINNFATELQVIKNYSLEKGTKRHRFYQQQQQTPRQNKQLNRSLMSESSQSTLVDHEFFDYEKAFLVCSEQEFILFLIYDGNFLTNEFNLEMFNVREQLTCATIYRVKNYQDQQLQGENNNNQQYSSSDHSIIIATGHKGGEIILWENLEIQHNGKQYSGKDILQLETFEYGLIIGDSQGVIHIWDFFMKNQLADIGMQTVINQQFPLINVNIHSILGYKSIMIIVSEEGDVVFLDTEIEKQKVKIRNIQRNNFITKLKGTMQAMCLMEEDDSIIQQENANNQTPHQQQQQYQQDFNARVFCVGINQNLNISIVYGFSLEMHQIVSMWEYEDLISSIDAVYIPQLESVYALGSLTGKIYLRIDSRDINQDTTQNLDNSQTQQNQYIFDVQQYRYYYMQSQQVNTQQDTQEEELPQEFGFICLKFSPDKQYLVGICQDSNIYVFQYFNETFFDRDKIRVKEIEGKERPVSLDFVDDGKSILVGTHSRNQYKMEISNLNQKNISQDQEKINCTVWNLSYPVTKDNNPENPFHNLFLPTIIGSDIKIFLMADHTGYIYFWKNQQQLKTNSGGFLRGHASQISQLAMTKSQNYFYSLGEYDNTLLEWKIDHKHEIDTLITESQQENDDDQQQQQIIKKQKQVNLPRAYVEHSIEQTQNINDQVLIREIIYCYKEKNNSQIQNIPYDSFLYFKGINDKQLYQLYKNHISQFSQSALVYKRPPSVSISIDYIYGFQCYDKRQTLQYVHKYYISQQQQQKLSKKQLAQQKADKFQQNNNNNKDLNNTIEEEGGKHSLLIPQFLQKEMLYAKRSLIPYQDTHEDCQRHFVYFTSRVAIVLNPLTNKQEYYQGHLNKISCLAVHPMKFFIATGEASRSPNIHIWNCLNCQTFKIIQTHHSNGILNLEFSRDASLLISISMDTQFSIQVTNWKSEEIVAFRNSGKQQIFDIVFNPYDKYEFVTAGVKNITFWEISARNLLRKQVVNIQEEYPVTCCITCLQYISYSLGNTIQSDIIAGNNNGDLILVVSGKYIIAKEKAHMKNINVLKIIELFKDKVLIITGGEDECIKIWDTQFSLINDINIRKNTGFHHDSPSNSINVSPQSIDIFACKYPKNSENNDGINDTDDSIIYPILLVGTRNGDILEASFLLEYAGLKQASLVNQKKKKKRNSNKIQFQSPQQQNSPLKNNMKNNKIKEQENESDSDSSQVSGSSQMSSSSESNSQNSPQSSSQNSQTNIAQQQQQQETELERVQNILRNQEQYGQQDIFKFNYQIYIRGHSSQFFHPYQKNKKIYFCTHPKENIMVSIGEDQNLIIYNIYNNKLLLMKYLKYIPTFIQYSPCARFIVIGFINGNLEIISTQFEKMHKYKNDHQYNYQIPTLENLQLIQDQSQKHPVLSIQFPSDTHKIMAVSYGNRQNFIIQSQNSQHQNNTHTTSQSQQVSQHQSQQQSLQQSQQQSQQHQQQQGSNKENTSFVKIFELQNDLQDIPKHQTQDIILYKETCSFKLDTTNIGNTFRTDFSQLAVSYMNFTRDNRFIILYYQTFENSLIRDNNDNLGLFQVRNIDNRQVVQVIDQNNNQHQSQLDVFNFPNNLVSNYVYYPNLLISDQLKQEDQQRDLNHNHIMSAMIDLQDHIVCGSIKGDVHFVKSSCLFLDEDQQYENMNQYNNQDQQMCLAKSYAAHSSPVNQLKLHNDEESMFTSGQLDECVIKWKFKFEDDLWDHDNLNYELSQIEDPAQEILTSEQFKTLMQSTLRLRQDVTEAIGNTNNLQQHGQQKVELKLLNIVGRKAINRHSNLFYDFDERLIYLSGCNLVLHYIRDDEQEDNQEEQDQEEEQDKTRVRQKSNSNRNFNLELYDDNDDNLDQEDDEDDDDDRYLKQEFINLDPTPNSSNAEISCFNLSKDKKLIVAGTIQYNARILIWEICSRTCLKVLTLTNCSIIQEVKFAYDNRHIIVLGLTNDYTIMLYLMDSHTNNILGCTNFPYSTPFKIMDIEMFPNSTNKFVACGVQYMCEWSLQGQILTYKNMEIADPDNFQAFVEPGSKHYDSEGQLNVTFMTLTFVNGIILSAGNDGYLYVWDEQRVVKKQNAHPNHAIYTLNSNTDTQFVSGGSDGKVIIWELGSSEYSFILEKIYEYDISFLAQTQIDNNPEIQIQSVCIGSKYILAGTKSGDIYETVKPDVSDYKSTTKVNKDLVKLRYNCSDQEIPKSIQFSGNSKKFYTLTQKGLFCVWNVKTFQRQYAKNFQRDAHSMIVCKKSQYIIIAFEQEIIFLDSSKKTKSQLPYQQHKRTLKFQAKIADVKLSFSEQMLAVALDPNNEQNAKIELYNAVNTDQIFEEFQPVPNLPTSLEFIDFSTDNFFLLYKDNTEEIAYIDVSNIQEKKFFYTEFDIEWCSKGIMVSDKTKGVFQYYSDDSAENKIMNIVKINEKTIAVTDEIGTIRIFNYPCLSGTDSGYMSCYSQHLNYINCCILSPDKKYLLTCSETDKCVFLWRILQKDPEYEEEEFDDQDDQQQEQDQNLQHQELDQQFGNNNNNNLHQQPDQQQQQIHSQIYIDQQQNSNNENNNQNSNNYNQMYNSQNNNNLMNESDRHQLNNE